MSRVPAFDRQFFRSEAVFSRIGEGGLGGKAEGLVRVHDAIRTRFEGRFESLELDIPRVAVLGTAAFDAFMERNRLYDVALDDLPDDRLAHAFQRSDLPSELVGDLRALAEEARAPLAVRSSSMLEDALERPFAGVYETKMIPNDSPDPRDRFLRLVEAVKLVYASTFFRSARTYRKAARIADTDEKMAVMLQEVVGLRHGDRFYPHVSAVCRSYSYYPTTRARPEDGVVSLALGLGKTIVDGGVCWTYSPRHPRAPAPFASTRRMLTETQTRFWAVGMGRPPVFDPVAETEYLVQCDLADAEYDGSLRYLASTYDAASDRLRPGVGGEGPRVLTFAPLLELREIPLNELVRQLLALCEDHLGCAVEIELAMTLPGPRRPGSRVGFVQVRPMATPEERVEVPVESLGGPDVLLASARAMGNGVVDGIRDVVYVRPESFEARDTPRIAEVIEAWNRRLVGEDRPYLLIGFGRWGSVDPWLGVPVSWGDVAGAGAIVEATLPGMDVEPSQGSHFFHNLSSTGVLYFTVPHRPGGETVPVNWQWLDARPAVAETDRVRHVRLVAPLRMRVDGRSGRGVVRVPEEREEEPHGGG